MVLTLCCEGVSCYRVCSLLFVFFIIISFLISFHLIMVRVTVSLFFIYISHGSVGELVYCSSWRVCLLSRYTCRTKC